MSTASKHLLSRFSKVEVRVKNNPFACVVELDFCRYCGTIIAPGMQDLHEQGCTFVPQCRKTKQFEGSDVVHVCNQLIDHGGTEMSHKDLQTGVSWMA